MLARENAWEVGSALESKDLLLNQSYRSEVSTRSADVTFIRRHQKSLLGQRDRTRSVDADVIRQAAGKSRGIQIDNFVQLRTIVDDEPEQFWSGQKPAKEALHAAVRRGGEQLERFENAHKS